MDETAQAHQVLGTKPGASSEEVKQAYRDLVKVWHPDRFGHDERLRLIAQDKLKEINTAHELLQAHLAGEPIGNAEDAPAPANRTGLWVVLIIAVLVATGAFAFLKQKSKPASTAKPATVAAPSPPPTNALHALEFDGSGAHVELATTGALTGTFTVELWVMTPRPKQDGTVLSSRSPQDFGFDLKLRQGKRFHGDIGDGKDWLMKMANITYGYSRGVWYHVAYVVTPKEFIGYVDGREFARKALDVPGTPLLYDDKHRLFLGTDPKDNVTLNGAIAELRIWNTARTEEQLKAARTAKLTGSEPGLRGWWRFAEGEGDRTEDSSGHGFTGKFSGSVKWSKKLPPELQ